MLKFPLPFLLLLSAIASALFLPSQININQTLGAFDSSLTPASVQNLTDPYYSIAIENCGDSLNDIHTRVGETKRGALSVMSDAIFGTRSSYGFTSMFKEDSESEAVQAVFGAIYHLTALRELKPNPMEPKAPRFACADPRSAQIYKNLDLKDDPWQRCLAESNRHNPLPAFYAEGTAYIFLCPAFFAQEDKPDRPHCPVVHENRFAGDPNIFYKRYQVYTLLYNLLRFYLGDNALSADSDPREELDWNNCVRLNPENSVKNPTNLQIYAAMVSQTCVESPDPFAPNYASPQNSTQNDSVPTESASYNPWPGIKATQSASSQSLTTTATAKQSLPVPLMFPANAQISGAATA